MLLAGKGLLSMDSKSSSSGLSGASKASMGRACSFPPHNKRRGNLAAVRAASHPLPNGKASAENAPAADSTR